MSDPKTAQQINSPQVGSVELPKTSELPIVHVDWKKHMDEMPTYAELQQQLTDLTACLEWADKNVWNAAPDVEQWSVIALNGPKDAKLHFTGPTLISAIKSAYRDKTKE